MLVFTLRQSEYMYLCECLVHEIFPTQGSNPTVSHGSYTVGGFFTAKPLGKPHIYIYPLLFRFLSYLGHHRALGFLCYTIGSH